VCDPYTGGSWELDPIKKEFTMNINKALFILGISIALTAAVLLLLDVIESGIAGLIGVVGISLIAASSRKSRK
jgi:hypothetical protein